MTITMDLYKQLALERSWDEVRIRRTLTDRQKLWIGRGNACNDKDQLKQIDEMMDVLGQAFRYLTKPEKRKRYDKALDEAYKNGTIKDETEEKMKSVLEQAIEYYRKGNIKLAAQYAQEAIDGKVNEPRAWDTLAQCHYDMGDAGKALDTVDDGLAVFGDDIKLNWLGARIATIGTMDYADAQRRINRLIEIAPDRSIGHTEQIFLHFSKGNEELALQEVDRYIEEHPDDNDFKMNAAYDIIKFSNTSFVQDPVSKTYIIADKKGYERCMRLREKAQEIYEDDYTKQQVEKARYYGTLEFNEDNKGDLLWMYGVWGYVFIALVMLTLGGGGEPAELLPIGLLSLALSVPPIILTVVSYRPYWQINRIYVTGDPGLLEKSVVTIGRAYVWLIKKTLWLCGQIIKYVFLAIVKIVMR